jgi:hypothetical protein
MSSCLACYGSAIAAAFRWSWGPVELDLSPWDSPKGLCNLGWVPGIGYWCHMTGQRYLAWRGSKSILTLINSMSLNTWGCKKDWENDLRARNIKALSLCSYKSPIIARSLHTCCFFTEKHATWQILSEFRVKLLRRKNSQLKKYNTNLSLHWVAVKIKNLTKVKKSYWINLIYLNSLPI